MSELDKIRSLVSETQARYSTAIGDLIQYSFAVKRENNELQRKLAELTAALVDTFEEYNSTGKLSTVRCLKAAAKLKESE